VSKDRVIEQRIGWHWLVLVRPFVQFHHMMINIWLFMAANATLVRAVALTLHRTTEIRSKTAPELSNFAFGSFLMVKKLLLASAALALFASPGSAADLPVKAPPLPPPVYDWTGFYVGGNIGWGWSHSVSTELPPGTGAFPTGTVFSARNSNGFLGGVQAGFNYQTPYHLVVGLEGDFDWTDISGTETTISTVTGRFAGFSSTTTGRLKDFALFTGRLGYAADNWLLYVKGGGALAEASSSGVGFLANGTLFDTTFSSSQRFGWVIGAGVEWGFAPGWSAKIEYNHIEFDFSEPIGIGSVETSGVLRSSFVSNRDSFDVVKGGINYRFNWGGAPVVAKY
jgi:outer membrane immunogenic protein